MQRDTGAMNAGSGTGAGLIRARGWIKWAMAVVTVAIVWGIRTLLDPALGNLQPFSPFLLPVLLMGWSAGRGPAALAAAGGFFVADYFFAFPRGSVLVGGLHEVAAASLFACLSACIIVVTHRMRRARERLEETLDSITDAFFALDRSGVLTAVNPAGELLLGKPRKQLVGYKLWEKFPESVNSQFHRATETALKTGQGTSFEEFCHSLKLWLDVHIFPTPGGAALYLRDITERKHAEEALRRSEERLRLAVETAALGLYERDLVTDAVVMDDSCKSILGVRAGEFGSDVMRRAVHPDDRERVLELVRRAYDPALREVSGADFRIVRPNGECRWVAGRGQAIFDDDLNPPGPVKFIAVLQDITERKRVEQDLARTRERLEQLVEERTARLRETVGELEHFSYTITHDMRAPLRAMQGYSQMLQVQETHLSTRARDFLRCIIESSQRMDLLITDALSYARVIREELRLEPVDPGKLLSQMLESYPELQPHRAEIEVLGPIGPVQGNRAALTQCFSNLLGNAIKFVPPGQKPVVRVWAERRDNMVRIWFEDNGIGIAPDQHQKIFEMFQRVSKDYEGTGIGLALVRKVVERMRGRVGVESELGKGSRFWVELPGAEIPAGTSFAA